MTDRQAVDRFRGDGAAGREVARALDVELVKAPDAFMAVKRYNERGGKQDLHHDSNIDDREGIVYGVEQYYHAPGKASTMVVEVVAREE